MKTVAIITGASSGMGVDFALQAGTFAACDEIWLVARRREALQKVADQITGAKPVLLTLDLATAAGQEALKARLDQEKPQVKLLVANAGYGKFGSFEAIDRAETLGMVDLNIRALTALVHDSRPYLAPGSGLILVASLVSYIPIPGMNVYAATKAYVRSFGTALHATLKPAGIKVTTLCPGPVDTEFAQVASDGKTAQLPGGSSSAAIVKRTYRALARNQSILLPRFDWWLTALTTRLMPGPWAAALTRRLYI